MRHAPVPSRSVAGGEPIATVRHALEVVDDRDRERDQPDRRTADQHAPALARGRRGAARRRAARPRSATSSAAAGQRASSRRPRRRSPRRLDEVACRRRPRSRQARAEQQPARGPGASRSGRRRRPPGRAAQVADGIGEVGRDRGAVVAGAGVEDRRNTSAATQRGDGERRRSRRRARGCAAGAQARPRAAAARRSERVEAELADVGDGTGRRRERDQRPVDVGARQAASAAGDQRPGEPLLAHAQRARSRHAAAAATSSPVVARVLEEGVRPSPQAPSARHQPHRRARPGARLANSAHGAGGEPARTQSHGYPCHRPLWRRRLDRCSVRGMLDSRAVTRLSGYLLPTDAGGARRRRGDLAQADRARRPGPPARRRACGPGCRRAGAPTARRSRSCARSSTRSARRDADAGAAAGRAVEDAAAATTSTRCSSCRTAAAPSWCSR